MENTYIFAFLEGERDSVYQCGTPTKWNPGYDPVYGLSTSHKIRELKRFTALKNSRDSSSYFLIRGKSFLMVLKPQHLT